MNLRKRPRDKRDLPGTLDVDAMSTENTLDLISLLARYGQEQVEFAASSQGVIDAFLAELTPSKDDVVYDLGAGYGHFVLCCAMHSSARYVGIELVEERVRIAESHRQRLGIESARFLCGNVLSTAFADATIIYMFSPFFGATLERLVKKLEAMAQQRDIRIAALFHVASRLAQEPWLCECERANDSDADIHTFGLRIFQKKRGG